MKSRRTVVIDEDVNKKILVVMRKRIQEEQKSISYSRVLNDIVRKLL